MKDLDFTPDRHRQTADRRCARKKTARLVSLMILSISTFSLWRYAQLGVASAKLEALQVSHAAQAPIVDLATVVEENVAEMRRRERLLGAASGGASMHQVLAELSVRLGEGVSLTAIEIAQADRVVGALDAGAGGAAPAGLRDVAHLNLRILGVATDEGRVAQAVDGLSSSKLVRDVELGYSRPGAGGSGSQREFELRCHLPEFE